MSDAPQQTPLVDLLRDVPKNLRAEWPIQWSDDGRETGHSLAPIGKYCHDAADRIEKLESENADLKRQLEEMRDQIVKRNDRIAELERQLEETEGALYAEGRLRRTAEQQLSEAQKNAERMRGAIIEMHNDWQRGDFNLSTLVQCDLRSALEAATAPKSEPGEADRK